MKYFAQLSHLVGPLAVLAWLLPGAAPLADRRPNVVVILTDDQGWGDLSWNGNQNLSTPHVDSLAKEGASFDRFYVCPVCSPTRAEFLTGRYHPRSGVYSTSAGGERMDLDEKTIADTFKAAGYKTAAFGKWHNGMQYPYHPNARGFDEYYGFCSGHWGNYFSPPLEHNGKIVRGLGFIVDDFTERAMEFLENHKDHPFFVYLPLNTPHSPMQVPDRWWNKFKDRDLKMHHRDPERENLARIRAALAMCENIDWNVGRLLKKLDALQLTDNTIVIYFCDNGPNGYRWNGGMKGRKGSTDEGGVRSPLLIRWPGRIEPGKTVTPISAAIDLLPTLAELADIPVVSTRPLDGVSLGPLLLENAEGPNRAPGDRVAPPPWDRLIFSHWGKRVSVRSQDFRLDHQGKLYDMAADPGQVEDISQQQPEVAARLRQSVANWKKQVLAETGTEDRPFPIGHPDFPSTQLPARDALGHGNITRSNRFPNCSFFTNWTSLDDRITWNAEVLTAGSYDVEIYYTCPARDVGSTIELSFRGQNLRGQIAETHDPPLRGGQHDRVARGESYVKDFQALKLGRIQLNAGRGELTLRAIHIAGSQVIDSRRLTLTRVDVPQGEPVGGAEGPEKIRGPLRAHPTNPRYFTDDGQRAVYLTGSHTWNNLVDMGPSDPPGPLDFDAYLQWLHQHNHNFFRLWAWELVSWDTAGNREPNAKRHHVRPHPWQRTGPGLALDGKPKFNLQRLNPQYFDRLRRRVESAGARGMYVAVMLFEGWGVQRSPNAWVSHPFHPQNNINGIDGDLNGDGLGVEIHSGESPEITAIQKVYARKVVNTVNPLDNVLYEISNENHAGSTAWQYDMIRFIQRLEQAKPKQHPVGMTFQFQGGSNQTLLDSPADWISPNPEGGYRDDPPPADGSKVIITDTDHLWGIGGNQAWVWKSFLRGLNPIFMDPYDGSVLRKSFTDQQAEPIRKSMGYTLTWSRQLNLARMLPRPDLASSGYCLAEPRRAYLVYLPSGDSVTVNMTRANGPFQVQWFHPHDGETETAGTIEGGTRREFVSPFGADDAVLFLKLK